MNFTKYETATGKILLSFSAPNPQDQCLPGEACIGGWYNGNEFYVENAEVVPRPNNPMQVDKTEIKANTVEVVTFTQIPYGTICRYYYGENFQEFEITDGTLEFATMNKGEHWFRFDSFPVKDKEFTVNAI